MIIKIHLFMGQIPDYQKDLSGEFDIMEMT